MGTIPRPKGFPIEGKRHMKELKIKFDIGFNEINHKIDMKVKKDYQVIISPLLQSLYLCPRSEIVVVTGDSTVSDQTL
jgi:hypothetical protein